DANLGTAIVGLLPVAAGRGKLAEAAAEFLRDAHRRGHAGFLSEQLAAAEPEVAERVRKAVLGPVEKVYALLTPATAPADLRDVPPRATAGGSRDGVAVAVLPPVLGGRAPRLDRFQVQGLLGLLHRASLTTPSYPLAAIRRVADPASLDAF